jgi:predicted RNA-binding Zn-ribbon protein involved in translation (DUF1610 family)
MSQTKLELSIPSDSDGFVLLQCPLCGEFFKLIPKDIKDDSVLEIWCPNCGLKSENYLSDEVIKLASNIIENVINKKVYNGFKGFEGKYGNISITFKNGKTPELKPEDPLISSIEMLEIQHYKCCPKDAKIITSARFAGSYCPFCGGIQDGNK